MNFKQKNLKLKIGVLIVFISAIFAITNASENIVITIIGFLCITSGLLSFLIFDELMEYEHKKYYSQWEADGKPGFFRWPKGTSQPWYDDPQKQLMGKWLFSTPYWITNDSYAKILIRIYRILITTFFVGGIIGLFL